MTSYRLRLETKKHIWIFEVVPMWSHRLEWSWTSDVVHIWWTRIAIDRLSKGWLQFCEDHGSGLESTIAWLEDELNKPVENGQ